MSFASSFQSLPAHFRQESYHPDQLGADVSAYTDHFPKWKDADIILVGCGDREKSEDYYVAANAIREQFYTLSSPSSYLRIADLGNLVQSESVGAYRESIAWVTEKLIKAGKFVILLGGDRYVLLGQSLAYENISLEIEYVDISPRLDVREGTEWSYETINRHILQREKPFVRQFVNLGAQQYWVGESERNYLANRGGKSLRYGVLWGQLQEAEPWLRTADMVSINLSVVRHADNPGAKNCSPGGFSALEIGRIARYIGYSPSVSSVSLTDYLPEKDIHAQSAQLSALLLWYMVEGFYQRKEENPLQSKGHFRRYSVQMSAVGEMVFWQSLNTNRWWIEVPYPPPSTQSVCLPCSEKDYLIARQDDIPERWLEIYEKLS